MRWYTNVIDDDRSCRFEAVVPSKQGRRTSRQREIHPSAVLLKLIDSAIPQSAFDRYLDCVLPNSLLCAYCCEYLPQRLDAG